MGAERIAYTHAPVGAEVSSVAGHYLVRCEERLPVGESEVLVVIGSMAVESCCCGTGGCGFAYVPGRIVAWKAETSESGEAVSTVEPIRDEATREALRERLLGYEGVHQVNFR